MYELSVDFWKKISIALGAACAAACGSDDGNGPTRAAVEPPTHPAVQGCDAIDLAPPAAGEGVQVAIDMKLEPGEEREFCKLVLAGQKISMNWSGGLFSKGSHHGLVWGTAYRDELPTSNIRGESVDASQAVACPTPSADWNVTRVLAGGRAVGSASAAADAFSKGVLPDNVALTVEANEVLLVNFHMVNATAEPLHACYKANLHGIPESQVESEAGTIFFYNSYITVPALGSSTAEMACPVTHDISLASAVSHMHSRGVGYRSSLLDGDPVAGGAELRTLHESTEWEEPLTNVYSPPLALKAGQWIRWSCDFENRENRDVAQGLQTTDEMCMFAGAYWPRSPQMDFCRATEGPGPGTGRNFGTGTKTGADFVDCWTNGPRVVNGGGATTSEARYATQRCVTESCPNVSARVNEYHQGLIDIASVTCD